MTRQADWSFLSFSSHDDRWLGGAYLPGTEGEELVVTARALGVWPGAHVCGVLGHPVPTEDLPPEDMRCRLLTREEIEAWTPLEKVPKELADAARELGSDVAGPG